MIVDLSQTPDQMLRKMKSHTRYKLRRAAEKDQLTYEHTNGREGTSIDLFSDHYDAHAAYKGLPHTSRTRYRILAQAGALDLSFIRDQAGDILSASSCLVLPKRIRGLHLGVAFRAASDPARRSMIGRANRYLRWLDMLRFKNAGVQWFDFGGWYTGSADPSRLRVNEWKAEFAGTVVQEFSGNQPLSFKGQLVCAYQSWRARAWSHRERRRELAHEASGAEDAAAI
jgi:hypothetical protein